MNRFAIIADLHLGLIGPQADGRTFGDVGALANRAASLVAHDDPVDVVLLGDIVNRGYDQEYARARVALAPLDDRLIPVLGNHELQRASIDDFESGK